MKTVQIILLVIIIAMSLAAGTAKILEMEQEVAFFSQVGLDTAVVRPFGFFQLAGALLAIYPKTRIAGSIVMGFAFLTSAILIFMSGNTVFGLTSLLPVAMSLLVAGNLAKRNMPEPN